MVVTQVKGARIAQIRILNYNMLQSVQYYQNMKADNCDVKIWKLQNNILARFYFISNLILHNFIIIHHNLSIAISSQFINYYVLIYYFEFYINTKYLFSCLPSYGILLFLPSNVFYKNLTSKPKAFKPKRKMKAHHMDSGAEMFFHRYLVDSKKMNQEKRKTFQNEDQMSFSTVEFGNQKTSLHKCRLVTIGEENLQQWPLYLLKRIAYIKDRRQKKGMNYQVFDQNVKKISQIRTEYLCYQILNKSHRVVRMIELINQNEKNQEDNKFFYSFLGKRKQKGISNAAFILELCNDGNLDERIDSFKNPLTENHIITYCCQILEGLVQLKKKGILHRDLRPCNIFLHNDEVKFGDFDSAFIYKQSQCSDIKSGIDINTTPQQIVQLASKSDKQLQDIGNLKLFQLQSKCDIYFFGMIIFRMVFKRNYEKKFQGTDIEYLIRQKNKEGFSCPKLLEVMKMCLYTNVQKRIDLVTLYDQMKNIEKLQYFTNLNIQRTYLSQDPLNLFSFKSLDPIQPEIEAQIEASISHTFTLSFVSIQYNFQDDFEKSLYNRSTKIYIDEVQRVQSKFYKNNPNANIWNVLSTNRKQLDRFLKIMESFVIKMSTRAYYYDYLYKVILKINTKDIKKKQQKEIMTQNKDRLQKQLIIVLKFLFQILSRTPFKIDKYYCQKNLPYETRKLFKDKIKINNKYNFFQGRAKTFKFQEFDTYKMINQFFNIEYEELDSDKFQTIYDNVTYMIENIDKRLKVLLSQSIVDLFRPYDSETQAKPTHMKELLFIMITLEKQKLSEIKKCNIVSIKSLLEPLFNQTVELDAQQAQLFFENYKKTHAKQVQESKQKESIQISWNLLAVSKKHLDCLFSFMAPYAEVILQPPKIQSAKKIEQEQRIIQEDKQEEKQFKGQLIEGSLVEGQLTKQNLIEDDLKNDSKRRSTKEKRQIKLSNQFIYKVEEHNEKGSQEGKQIEVKVFDEQENNLSEFNENLQNNSQIIMT